MATEPTIVADSGQPKVPFLLRRSGELRVLRSPLSIEQARERFALYLGAVPTALAYFLFARGLRRLSAGETARSAV